MVMPGHIDQGADVKEEGNQGSHHKADRGPDINLFNRPDTLGGAGGASAEQAGLRWAGRGGVILFA